MQTSYLDYRTYFFDCDGVILDSNAVKARAFEEVCLAYGSKADAAEATRYYKAEAGAPRLAKVDYFFGEVLKSKPSQGLIEEFQKRLNLAIFDQVRTCSKVRGIEDFIGAIELRAREAMREFELYVISGTPEAELKELLKSHGLFDLFRGILGSPQTKIQHLERLQAASSFDPKQAVFFGDARIDYEAAERFGIDFVFVSRHTEFAEYETFFMDKPVRIVRDFCELS